MENFESPPQLVPPQEAPEAEKTEEGINLEQKEVIHPNTVESKPLTAYDEEFIIEEVKEGDDVLVGKGLVDGNYYLRCDFSSFEEKLKVVTIEKLEEFFIQAKKFEEQAPNLDENTRRLLHSCWRVARITKNMLGDLGSEFARNNSFNRFKVEGERFCIKPLSQCKGEAVCSEYTLMAHHILKKLGIESSIVVGAFSADPNDQLADRHTFLVLEDGKLVFDPTHTATEKDCWPPKVFVPEKPLTLENLQDMSVEGESFGHKIKCTDLLTKDIRIYGSGAV